MQKISISNLGPVKRCELEINDFTVFTGPQASGKSTIAKSIFFFKNIKNILFEQVKKKCLFQHSIAEESLNLSLKNYIEREIRSNFLQTFGTTWHMDTDLNLTYHYTDETWIEISLRAEFDSPNYIWIDFSHDLTKFIYQLEKTLKNASNLALGSELPMLKNEIATFFKDTSEIIYIPAGRSMITLLSTQLSYIYSFMDDTQKKSLDYCTQNYLERILRLKPEFISSAAQMIQDTIRLTDRKINKPLLLSAAELINAILQGEYRYVDGEERLQISKSKYVKINFASSGQQEVVWILNVMFYHLLNNKKTCFIIEEPESHLFPNAQKLISEFIALAKNDGKNQIFITTHSPYILGTINNLLYADKISEIVDKSKLESIISSNKWLKFSILSAYFIDHGFVSSCTDDEFGSIKNEIIDGASEDINGDFEKMVLLKESCLLEEK